MNYERIPADPAYLQALGRAFYNFVYLESIVVHIIGRLHSRGYGAVKDTDTAGMIADTLRISIERSSLPNDLCNRLLEFQEKFRLAVRHDRNDLLHSRPYSIPSGEQRLSRRNPEVPSENIYWPTEKAYESADLFAKLAIEGSELFHDEIAPLFPNPSE